MPKIVDHDERRRAFSSAFQGQLVAHGLAAATYARVAAAAGVSVGTIQHYFASRETLVQFVLEDLLASRERRVQSLVADLEADGQPLRRIVAHALVELLPLDEVRRREYVVDQQLRAEAWSDAGLARLLQTGDEHLHQRVRAAVQNGKRCGEVAPDVDVDTAAVQILATGTGLAQALASASASPDAAPFDTEAALTVLDPVLGLVFTGRCHHYEGPARAALPRPAHPDV